MRLPIIGSVLLLACDGTGASTQVGGSSAPADTGDPIIVSTSVGSVRVVYAFLYDPATDMGVSARADGNELAPYVAFKFSPETDFADSEFPVGNCSADFSVAPVRAPFAAQQGWSFGFEGLEGSTGTDCVGTAVDELFDAGLVAGLQSQTWQFAIGGPIARDAIPWADSAGVEDFAVGAAVMGDLIGGATPAFAVAYAVDSEGEQVVDEDGFAVLIPPSDVNQPSGLVRAYYRVWSVPSAL